MALTQPQYLKNPVLDLGGVVFSIVSETPINHVGPTDLYFPFLCSDQPDVVVRCRGVNLRGLRLRADRRLYADGDAFSVYGFNKGVFLVFGPTDAFNGPHLMAISTNGFRDTVLYSNRAYGEEFAANTIARLLEYPPLPIIMVYSLAAKGGLMIHACGVDQRGNGYLFAGKSDQGKSTMAKLWKDTGVVLNDECVVVRRNRGRFWLYGTPWSGEHGNPSLGGVPLAAIFFLSHSDKNHADRCEQAEAAALLLARSFPPLWDQQAMKSCLDFMSDLVSAVPCYRLGFVPTNEVVDFVRCLT